MSSRVSSTSQPGLKASKQQVVFFLFLLILNYISLVDMTFVFNISCVTFPGYILAVRDFVSNNHASGYNNCSAAAGGSGPKH